MNGELIGKRHDSQEAAAEIIDCGSETTAILLLQFGSKRHLDDSDAHLFRQVRPLPHRLVLEVRRELVSGHACSLTRRDELRKPGGVERDPSTDSG